MGLFGSDNADPKTKQLAEDARGDSVTEKRLTTVEKGLTGGRDYFNEKSAVDFLENEQPHHLFPTTTSGEGGHQIIVENGANIQPEGSYRSLLCVTDRRILFMVGDDDEDWTKEVKFERVRSVNVEAIEPSVGDTELIHISTEDNAYFFTIALGHFGDNEVQQAAEYIAQQSNADMNDSDDNVQLQYEKARDLSIDDLIDSSSINLKLGGYTDDFAEEYDRKDRAEVDMLEELGKKNVKYLIEKRGDDIEDHIMRELTGDEIDKNKLERRGTVQEMYESTIDELDDLISVASNLDDNIEETTKEELSLIRKPSEFESPKDAKHHYEETAEKIDQLRFVFKAINEHQAAYPDLPFDSFLDIVVDTYLQNDGIDAERVETWHEIIASTAQILEFLSDVDTNHPSINEDEWRGSISLALEEEFPNVLRPIQQRVENMGSSLWDQDDFEAYSWQEFEVLIGALFDSTGYDTSVTSETADLGVDVWATNQDERVAIQVKQYQQGNAVGRETLQKLSSTLAKGDADRVIVVTTSTFARTAEQWSVDFGPEIELIDGNELVNMLNNSDLPPPR